MDPKERDTEVAAAPANDTPQGDVADGSTNDRISEIEEQLRSYAEALEAERTAREKAEKEAAEARRLAEEASAVLEAQMVAAEIDRISNFVDGLVKEMRLPPAASEPTKNLLIAAASVGGKVSSFAFADVGEAGDKTLLDLAMEAFSAIPAPEPVQKDVKAATREADAGGVDVRAYAYDPQAARLVRERVDAYRKENPDVSYAEALKAVIGQGLQ